MDVHAATRYMTIQIVFRTKAISSPTRISKICMRLKQSQPAAHFTPWVSHIYAAEIYQCTHCGRLMIFRDSNVAVSFLPEEKCDNLLHSYKGEKWRGFLSGSWLNGKRSLWWYTNGTAEGDTGHLTNFSSWNEMESRYKEIFKKLKSAGQLRSAMLVHDGEEVHSWFYDPHGLDI